MLGLHPLNYNVWIMIFVLSTPSSFHFHMRWCMWHCNALHVNRSTMLWTCSLWECTMQPKDNHLVFIDGNFYVHYCAFSQKILSILGDIMCIVNSFCKCNISMGCICEALAPSICLYWWDHNVWQLLFCMVIYMLHNHLTWIGLDSYIRCCEWSLRSNKIAIITFPPCSVL